MANHVVAWNAAIFLLTPGARTGYPLATLPCLALLVASVAETAGEKGIRPMLRRLRSPVVVPLVLGLAFGLFHAGCREPRRAAEQARVATRAQQTVEPDER